MSFDVPQLKTWLDPPAWLQDAACRELPWEMFFLPDSETLYTPRKGVRSAETLLPGLRYCQACLVRSECLEEALSDPRLDVGIRGGLTSVERRALRRKRLA